MTGTPGCKVSRPGGARHFSAVLGGLAVGLAAISLIQVLGRRTELGLCRHRLEGRALAGPSPEDHETRDPGRGRLARRPEHIPRKGWLDILWRTAGAYFGDRVGFVSGGVTFFVVLAMFPTLAVFVTLYGLFSDPEDAWGQLQFLHAVLPSDVAIFLGDHMQRLAQNSAGEMTLTLVWTVVLSLWVANTGIKTLFYGLNVAYNEIERRNVVHYNLVCLAFTISGLAAVLITAGLVVGVPVGLGLLGLGEAYRLLDWLRWPVLFMGYVLALTVVYRFGPCRARARWRWLTPGAIAAASLSVLVSFLFSGYLANFMRTDSYGPLAAFMGFFLWVWLSVQMILMGAELNAEIEHQTAIDTTTGPEQPLGRRGARVADNVGPRHGSPAALAFTLKHAEALVYRLSRRDMRS